MYNPSVDSAASGQRKRHPSHLNLPSSSKRLKTGNAPSLAGTTLPSSPLRSEAGGRQRAEQWFDDTNKNASKVAPVPDDDPPFYIDRQPSSDGNSVCAMPSEGSCSKLSAFGKPTAPTRSLLAHMDSSESNSEDYRSVIDDLTIQNRKLKKKLRHYEKLHCSHLEQEKLFEVRIHGLAGNRKRELEQTLQSFASSIGEGSPERPYLNPTPSRPPASEPMAGVQATVAGGLPSSESITEMRKPSSASTSCSKPIDSAYASMSGQTGTSQLQPLDRRRLDRVPQSAPKHHNVQSYLHDIPETLVPKHTMAMSDKSKSKLVVRRLEQIFTGKGAASRSHTQSHQQQEVSHSAAQADQVRGPRSGREGVREARILPLDADLQVDSLAEAHAAVQRDGRDERGIQASRDQSPNQRPTRPLDLDIHRAQVPEDNIDYIRHLGLASPTKTKSAPNEGWVYLNLLTSMAQLHTLNVTPEFIRHAIADVSSKFELSSDGTNVRWLGGRDGSKMSSDGNESSDMEEPGSSGVGKLPMSSNMSGITPLQDQQEPNTGLPHSRYQSSAAPNIPTRRKPVSLKQETDESNFQYKPLFFHRESSQESDDSQLNENSNLSSDVMENATGMNSGINSGSHGMHETEVKLRTQNTENGPIIFYHKARFCTDLSGDPTGAHMDEDTYHRYSQKPIGCPPGDLDDQEHDEQSQITEPTDIDFESARNDRSTLDLEDLKSCFSDCFSTTDSAEVPPIPMEVSGLGGIQPEDNFVVNVKIRHHDKKTRVPPTQSASAHRLVEPPQHGLAGAVSSARDTPRSQPIDIPVRSEVVATTKKELRPSSLPPPSYACLPFSSSSSEDEEDGCDELQSPVSDNDLARSSRRPKHEFPSKSAGFFKGSSSDEANESPYVASSVGSDDDDDSIDLLAHARVLDPETIAQRERDFDDNHIPPGSVAATAGESSTAPVKTIPRIGSDVDSMSVDGDGRSSMDISD